MLELILSAKEVVKEPSFTRGALWVVQNGPKLFPTCSATLVSTIIDHMSQNQHR